MFKVTPDWSKCICSGIIGALVSSSLNLATKADSPLDQTISAPKIVTQSLTIIDKNGDPVGAIGTSSEKGYPMFTLGKTLGVFIEVTSKGPIIRLHPPEQEAFDHGKGTDIEMLSFTNGSRIVVDHGENRCSISSSPEQTAFSVMQHGEPRALVGSNEKESPFVQLLDANGHTFWGRTKYNSER
jgi:hypothetical protein